MFTSGISLAYYGQCKLDCYVDDEKVCWFKENTFVRLCTLQVAQIMLSNI